MLRWRIKKNIVLFVSVYLILNSGKWFLLAILSGLFSHLKSV